MSSVNHFYLTIIHLWLIIVLRYPIYYKRVSCPKLKRYFSVFIFLYHCKLLCTLSFMYYRNYPINVKVK